MEYRADRSQKDLASLKGRLRSEPDISKRWQIAGDFFKWRQEQRKLLVEGGRVYFFVWSTAAGETVSVVGPFNRWRVGALPMKRLHGTPLLVASLPYRPFIPFYYLYASDSRWFLDPLCQHFFDNTAGRRCSFFSPLLQEWPAWGWTPRLRKRGRTEIVQFVSKSFRNTRPVLLYTTPDAVVDNPWRLLIVEAAVDPDKRAVYANLLDNTCRRYSMTNMVIAVVPSLDPASEFPTRAIDYLDMIKHDLSRHLTRVGWAPEGAVRRVLVMRGRGAGFLLLSLFKGVSYFSRVILMAPETAPYNGFIRYFSRLRRPGRLSGIAVRWATASGRPEPQYQTVREGLARYGLTNLTHFPLPAPTEAPDKGVAELEWLLRTACIALQK